MFSDRSSFRTETSSKKLDFRAIGRAVWLPFSTWAAAVIFVAFDRGQPGVVCATPVAWLMACWVGMSCVARSRSLTKSALLTETALAGGVFGLLQGVLFVAVAPFMGEIKPDERPKAVLMSLAVVLAGIVVSAILSMAVGAARANQRGKKMIAKS